MKIVKDRRKGGGRLHIIIERLRTETSKLARHGSLAIPGYIELPFLRLFPVYSKVQ